MAKIFRKKVATRHLDNLFALQPQLELKETAVYYIVTTRVPDLAEKNIHISLSQNILTITGERKDGINERGRHGFRMERSWNWIYQSLPFDRIVDATKTYATFQHGILTIVLPKSSKGLARTRKIPLRR